MKILRIQDILSMRMTIIIQGQMIRFPWISSMMLSDKLNSRRKYSLMRTNGKGQKLKFLVFLLIHRYVWPPLLSKEWLILMGKLPLLELAILRKLHLSWVLGPHLPMKKWVQQLQILLRFFKFTCQKFLKSMLICGKE